MQQRQLRLGDILDDYCPRERRVTNHAVVAMIGEDVKQTRCTTCDAEHEYKHAKVPRHRKKGDTPAALTSQILAGTPKRVAHDEDVAANEHHEAIEDMSEDDTQSDERTAAESEEPSIETAGAAEGEEPSNGRGEDEGPIHRRLIRASLPRPEGQQPPARPIPEFTIRQPGRQNRFRPRHQRGGPQQHGQHGGGQQFHGNRSNGGRGDMRSGRPQGQHRHGPHKRSK